MTTFHTAHGTVRYSGIRRYIVVANGQTIKRTDSLHTAQETATKLMWNASIVDTTADSKPAASEPSERICVVSVSVPLTTEVL